MTLEGWRGWKGGREELVPTLWQEGGQWDTLSRRCQGWGPGGADALEAWHSGMRVMGEGMMPLQPLWPWGGGLGPSTVGWASKERR